MSHRAMDEVIELEAQMREVDAEIFVALSADVVDLSAVIAARRRRRDLAAWLKAGERGLRMTGEVTVIRPEAIPPLPPHRPRRRGLSQR